MPALSPQLLPMVQLSDEELVRRVLSGDTFVFELLMRRHNQRLYRLARSVVTTEHEAEDVVQEAYLRAYTNLPRFEFRATFSTWISRITFHEALRFHRKQRLVFVCDPHSDTMAANTAPSPRSEDPIDHRSTKRAVASAIDSLPTHMRSIVMLRLVDGLDTKQTAMNLRLTETNVKVSLHRARKLLARHLGSSDPELFRSVHEFDGAQCDRIVAAVLRKIVA